MGQDTRTPTTSSLGTYAYLTLGMGLFGSATPISKIVGQAFPATIGSGLRMLTAAVILVPVLAVAARRGGEATGGRVPLLPPLGRADLWRLAGIAAVGTFGFTLLLLFGLRLVPGVVGAVVMATTPAVTAVGSVLFLQDKADRYTVGGLVLAVSGVVVVNVTGSAGGSGSGWDALVWAGTALVFGAICAEAAYTLLGKTLTADLSPLQITTVAAVLAGVLFLPFAAFQAVGFDWTGPTAREWAYVVAWGAGTLALGSVLWFRGVMRVSGTTASAFMAMMPISALVLSYVLLGEPFSWWHVVGMAVAVAGIGVIAYRDAQGD